MALEAGQILSQISPTITKIGGTLYTIGQLLLWVFGFAYVIMMFRYNVKVEIMEYIKGRRAVIRQTRAVEIFDKKNNKPLLRLWDFTIFWGKLINTPESECIFPYKSILAKKMYKFVLKDGIYHPVPNYIVGKAIKIINQETNQIEEIYGGIETSRNFDVEEAIANKLERDAVKYKNKKPVEMVALYGVLAITIIGSIVIIVYSLKRVGDLFVTLQQLKEPIQNAVTAGIQQKLNPAGG